MFMGMFCTAIVVLLYFAKVRVGCIYTYRRGPLRCLSLSEGNAKAEYVG